MLDLLATGDLPEKEAEFYLRHIAACPGCQAKYDEAVKAAKGIKSAIAETIPKQSEAMDLWPSVRESIARPARRQRVFGRRRVPRLRRSRACARNPWGATVPLAGPCSRAHGFCEAVAPDRRLLS